MVAYKRYGDPWKHTIGDTVLENGDTVMVFGPQEERRAFRHLEVIVVHGAEAAASAGLAEDHPFRSRYSGWLYIHDTV